MCLPKKYNDSRPQVYVTNTVKSTYVQEELSKQLSIGTSHKLKIALANHQAIVIVLRQWEALFKTATLQPKQTHLSVIPSHHSTNMQGS